MPYVISRSVLHLFVDLFISVVCAQTRLLERQTSTVCRVRVFSLLLELASIELSPPTNSGQGLVALSGNEKSSGSGSNTTPSFGHHALRVVRDVMPNVVGARDLFIACVEDPLIEVLSSMSMPHLIALLPLLLDILSDPYFESMIHTDPDADNLFTLLSKTADVFKKVFLSLLSNISPSDGLSRPDARSLVYSLQQCGRVLTIIAQSTETAQAIHGDGVFTAFLFQNWRLFQRLDSDERWAHESFHFFRMIGRICRGSPEAAVYLSGGVPSQMSTELVAMLIGVFKVLPEKPNVDSGFMMARGMDDGSGGGVQRYSPDSYNAALIYCLASLLLNSERAATLMKDRKEGMKTAKDYHTRLLKWVQTYENGDFLASCIDAVLLITRSPGLKPFKVMLEDRTYLCTEIQKIFKRLLTLHNGKTTRSHRTALMRALELMTYYSTIDKISSGLNSVNVAGYDRLSVLSNILRYRGESALVDNDVKLSAARCLTQVNLHDLTKDVVVDLIASIKDSPASMGSAMNACMTCLLSVAFRMAMFEPGTESGQELQTSGSEHCGEVFRKEATEACAALYATLQHGIVDDKSPVRVDSVTVKYRLAMVKVLMTAWHQMELRQSCESRGSIDVMVKALRAEQNALRWCKMRHERLINAGRCVDCEELLVKNNFAQPSRTLATDDLALPTDPSEGSITTILTSIRCTRCKANVTRGRSVIQETYTPLYLEQTWSGHDIRAILETLRNLKEVDLVAFRVLHQGANILEGTTYAACVTRLLNAPSFDAWNRDLPGRSVRDCQEWEKQNWQLRQRRLRWAEAHEYPISTAAREDILELAEMQVEHYALQYNYREGERLSQIDQLRASWESAVGAASSDERLVHLVIKDGKGKVIACCSGGALRESTYVPPQGNEAEEGPYAEMYLLMLSPTLSESESSKIQHRLLSAFSSRAFTLGYRTCYAKAHRSERALFSVAHGVDTDLAANAQAAATRAHHLAASGKNASALHAHPGAKPSNMGASVKEFLYEWTLYENVWRRTPAHDEFMSLNGLQLFLDFVLRDTIKIHQLFTSTIRDVMEEFGDELQDSLTRHAEATKSAGQAIRMPLPSADELKKSAGNSANSAGGALMVQDYLDYEKQLPPPLPVDAHELGDAPIAGSGVLAVLNHKDDNLYKHLFPLMLQNRFRADPYEHNHAEESPWMMSLLGTAHENLLTIAANYASAASVYDESTWIRKEKSKRKVKPLVPSSSSDSINATPRASVDTGATSATIASVPAGSPTATSGAASSTSSTATNAAAAAANAQIAAANAAAAAVASLETDLLKHQAESACAAIFRACYTLVVSGSLSVRRKAASVLRAPANFYKLRCLMASFSYGIRSSILQPPSPPYLCAMSTNFMQLMEELLPENTVGIEEGLTCLEIYEVFFLVIADLFTSLMSLLRSRNEHARDPMHALRRLSEAEEGVMAAATTLCFKLIQRIQHLTLFPAGGDYLFLVRANTEARAKAMQELLLRNKPLFQAALFTFLVYDLESLPDRNESEEDEAAEAAALAEEEEQKFHGAGAGAHQTSNLALPTRDSMRIHITWILSSFFHVSPAIQRDFLHQYHISNITMGLGIRPSLLHSLLAAQQQLVARDKVRQMKHPQHAK